MPKFRPHIAARKGELRVEDLEVMEMFEFRTGFYHDDGTPRTYFNSPEERLEKWRAVRDDYLKQHAGMYDYFLKTYGPEIAEKPWAEQHLTPQL